MGSKHSSQHGASHNGANHHDATMDTHHRQPHEGEPQLEPQPSHEEIHYAPLLTPSLLGFASDAERQFRIVPESAIAAIHAAIPPSPNHATMKHHDSWFMIYNSHIHGASFNRLVQLIVDRGPTLIVIRDHSSRRTFGGYNEASWTTVAQREKESKSIAASNARAKRNGMVDQVQESRPSNQAGTFFGNDRSFLFRCSEEEGTAPTVFHARPEVNSNFMYLFDVHPDEDKVGIGMGGVPPSHFGWFLNRWLEEGACRGARCSTYHNPMLSATATWTIGGVEVYALGANAVEELKTKEVFADGKTAIDTGASIRKGRIADKVILELNDNHHFFGDEARCRDDGDDEGDVNRCLA
jgi:hypothetical protein